MSHGRKRDGGTVDEDAGHAPAVEGADDRLSVSNPVTGVDVRAVPPGERAALAPIGGGDDAEAVEIRLAPDASGPPPHLHPSTEERFVVRSGRVRFRVDGRERVLEPGTSIRVSPGTSHGFANAGDDTAVLYGRTVPDRPGLAEVVATLFGLAVDGRTDDRGRPGLLQGAAIAERTTETYLADVPVPLQRAYGRVLGPVARALGYEATYDRYLEEGFWRDRSDETDG